MKINKLLLVSALLALPVFAAEGVPAAAEGAKPPYGHPGAMREACKADPEKCRQEHKARRDEMCAQNPEKCKEMKARMAQRHEQCKADPEKCNQERKARHGNKTQDKI